MNEKQMQEMAVSILLDEYTQLDVAQLLKEYEEDGENGELPNVPRSDLLTEASKYYTSDTCRMTHDSCVVEGDCIGGVHRSTQRVEP